jgi:bifunctional non-homologous end joining protein LigD
MLATLTDTLPTQGKWIYEPKLDGVRALIYVSGGAVRIYSRNR